MSFSTQQTIQQLEDSLISTPESNKQQRYNLTKALLTILLDTEQTAKIKEYVNSKIIDVNTNILTQEDLITLALRKNNIEIIELFAQKISTIKPHYFTHASDNALPHLATAAHRLDKVQKLAQTTLETNLDTNKKIQILKNLEKYNLDYTKLFKTTSDPFFIDFMLATSRISPDSQEAQAKLRQAIQKLDITKIELFTKYNTPVSLEMIKTSVAQDSKEAFDLLISSPSKQVLSNTLLFSITTQNFEYAQKLIKKDAPITPEHLLAFKEYTPQNSGEMSQIPLLQDILFKVLKSPTTDTEKLITLKTIFEVSICRQNVDSYDGTQETFVELGKKLLCNSENIFTAEEKSSGCNNQPTQTNSESDLGCIVMNEMLGISDNSNCETM